MARVRKEIEHDAVVTWFASRMRQLRSERGMTQAELAEAAQVSPAYIGRLERAGAAPGIDLVARLAVALGSTAAELMPATAPPDASVAMREKARRLFEELVEGSDQATLSLLVQLLWRLTQTASEG